MLADLVKYNCQEYLGQYYSGGLFHPTEAYDLFPHDEIIRDEINGHLQIGGIWDDMDSKICYRDSMKGVWGRYNYDGKYYLISDTLKEFVEGWYQWNSNHWGAMTSEIQWHEIANFYKINIERYNWESNKLLTFVNQVIEKQMLNHLYVKAYSNSLSISSINGFIRRANNNMVEIWCQAESNEFSIHYKDSFFKENFSRAFGNEEVEFAMHSIKEWVGM